MNTYRLLMKLTFHFFFWPPMFNFAPQGIDYFPMGLQRTNYGPEHLPNCQYREILS